MRQIIYALAAAGALTAAPAAAQSFTPGYDTRAQMEEEQQLCAQVSRAAFGTNGAVNIGQLLSQRADARGYSPQRKTRLLALCTVYNAGVLEGMERLTDMMRGVQ